MVPAIIIISVLSTLIVYASANVSGRWSDYERIMDERMSR